MIIIIITIIIIFIIVWWLLLSSSFYSYYNYHHYYNHTNNTTSTPSSTITSTANRIRTILKQLLFLTITNYWFDYYDFSYSASRNTLIWLVYYCRNFTYFCSLSLIIFIFRYFPYTNVVLNTTTNTWIPNPNFH